MTAQEPQYQDPKRGLLSGPRTTVSHVPPTSQPRPSLIAQTGLHFLLLCLASALFAITAWFAQATFSERSVDGAESTLSRTLRIDVGSTLTVLSILSGLLSVASAMAVSKSLETALWTSASGEKGISCLRFLGVSPTTNVKGMLGIILTGRASLGDRVWTFLRLCLLGILWSTGVLLFIQTSVAVAYTPVYTYNVTAGLGPFNGSLVSSYLSQLQNLVPEYKFTVVPYTIFAIVYNLVVNPMHSLVTTPIRCHGIDCDSYLMTGGLLMTTPWPPVSHMDLPTIEVYNVPGIQIEFERGLSSGDSFDEKNDCSVFGQDGYLIGMELCIAKSKVNDGSMIAGLYVCPNGVQNRTCLPSSSSKPNLTTKFSVYSRQANQIASRANFSIMSLTEVGEPSLVVDTDIPPYKSALNWLLDFNASGIPATTSIAEHFWTAQDQLSNQYWSGVPYQTFQSLLAFPFWQFNANNYGNTQLVDRTIISTLPPEFYTAAAIVEPYTRIIINKITFALFVAFQSLILAFAWVLLLGFCIYRPEIPEITSYPLIDFAFKAADTETDRSFGYARSSDIAPCHGDSDVRGALGRMRIGKRKAVDAQPMMTPLERRDFGG